MQPPATPVDPGRARPPTRPGDLPQPAPSRPQPPLREVLKGLEVRELEGETVFDQLFGLPPHDAR